MLTNKRKEWICPLCPQTCGRHWNFKVHISRQHPDLSPGEKTQEYDISPDQWTWATGTVDPLRADFEKTAYLANTSHPALMRWAITQSGLAQPADIKKWTTLFETNEGNYMMNPNTMLGDMKDYFGEKHGEAIFDFFVQLVRVYGIKENGRRLVQKSLFDISQPHRKLNRQGQGSNRYSYDDGHQYTQHAGHPSAPYYYRSMMERFIRQTEEDKVEEKMKKQREELDKEGVRQAFEGYLRAMSLRQLQNLSRDGNSASDPLSVISNLVNAGMMVPVPAFDEKGNKEIRYELTSFWQQQDPRVQNGLDFAMVSKLIENIYEKNTEILIRCINSMRLEYGKGTKLPNSNDPLQGGTTDPQKLNADKYRLESETDSSHHEEMKESEEETEQKTIRGVEFSGGQIQAYQKLAELNCKLINPLPIFNELLQGQRIGIKRPASILKAIERLMEESGEIRQTQQPHAQLQKNKCLEKASAAQEAIKQKIQDQLYIRKIQKMQEELIMEKQKSVAERRIEGVAAPAIM